MSLKILALSAALTVGFLSTSFAEGLGGFYIGGQAGGSFSQTKYDLADGPGGLIDLYHQGKSSSIKPVVGAMMGYNYIIKKSFLLGAEVGVDALLGGDTRLFWQRVSADANAIEVRSKRKGPGYYALAKFGVMVSDCTAVILGVGVKSVKATYRINDTFAKSIKEVSKQSARLHFLAGVEGLFKGSKHIGWRASYTFTGAQRADATTFPSAHAMNNPGAYARFNRKEHQALAGIFWKF